MCGNAQCTQCTATHFSRSRLAAPRALVLARKIFIIIILMPLFIHFTFRKLLIGFQFLTATHRLKVPKVSAITAHAAAYRKCQTQSLLLNFNGPSPNNRKAFTYWLSCGNRGGILLYSGSVNFLISHEVTASARCSRRSFTFASTLIFFCTRFLRQDKIKWKISSSP